MRTLFRTTLVFALIVLSAIAANAFMVDGVCYEINDDGSSAYATFERWYIPGGISYENLSGSIVIPETVNYKGKTYPVTAISQFAFFNCANLTSVVIGDSVKTIGRDAFSGTGLTSVTIGNSVKDIGFNAFCGTYLKSVTIPNSVTSIGDQAFMYNTEMTSVIIGNSVTSFGEIPFSDCHMLTNIVVDPDNPKYDSRDNCNAIIETATNSLIIGCKNTNIPNSVTSIGSCAFYECKSLTSITIPSSVTYIGLDAFMYCSGLTTINCKAITPPYCIGAFSRFPKSSCTLYVHRNAVELYRAAKEWKDFTNIVGVDVPGDVNGDWTTDLSDINEVINVFLGLSASPYADVDGNGGVDIFDVNMIVNLILNK